MSKKMRKPRLPEKACLDGCDGCWKDGECAYQAWAFGKKNWRTIEQEYK